MAAREKELVLFFHPGSSFGHWMKFVQQLPESERLPVAFHNQSTRPFPNRTTSKGGLGSSWQTPLPILPQRPAAESEATRLTWMAFRAEAKERN
mmetsp:Transcript_17531/g.42066  ORF Transcript_17531/g.42066 Transcript_17531/m.42066 type:complete len:94 (-) Transcript_17531:2208-2489(-)